MDFEPPGADGADATRASRRRFRVQLLAITAVGAVWRLGYLFAAKWDQPLLLNDSLYYSIQAGLNSEGHWFQDALSGQPGAEHGPLTALYLTPWSLGAGDGVRLQRLAVTLAGIAVIAVIGLLGRRAAQPGGPRFADQCGLVAAAIAAIYPNLWLNDSLVMSETLAVLLVSLALYGALDYHARPTVRSAVLLGVLAGLATLTRSELGLLVVGFALVGLLTQRQWRITTWAGRRRALLPVVAIVVAAGLTLMPWTVWNLARFNRPVLLTTNDGNTLLGANCDTTYYDDIGGWDLRCLGPLETGGLGHEADSPDASDRSHVRREQALEYVGDHVGRLPVVVAGRVGRLLDVYGLESLVRLDVGEEKARWAVWSGIVCWWVLAGLAVAGWAVAAKRRLAARWWLAVPAIAVLLTAVLFYGAHRIRAPAEPTVVVLAAIALTAAYDRRSASATET